MVESTVLARSYPDVWAMAGGFLDSPGKAELRLLFALPSSLLIVFIPTSYNCLHIAIHRITFIGQSNHLNAHYTPTMVSETCPTTAGLGNLPVELQETISDFLERSDLLSFRLISRRLCGVSEERFAAEYFTTRIHLVTRFALDALVHISNNPRLMANLKHV
jgi:hypothetical protein